jgi:hexosaminidase
MAAADNLILLPEPRHFTALQGSVRTPVAQNPIISTRSDLPAQGYRLRIGSEVVRIEAGDEAGAFYGKMTLRQILRHCPRDVLCCEIEDWPDFAVRGVMLDISRDKVPTMETLFALVDNLAEWKINHLELYTEHTFAYRRHREVWEHASPMTAEEIRQLEAYCHERFIELVANQQSFGHFEHWLKHSKYQHLAAGEIQSCLDPANPLSLALLQELYVELLPNFTSRKFNVGCDETYGIEGRVYLDFLLKIHELVKRHGRTMHFWGDIVLKHPEFVAQLPRDVAVLEWGYEADHPFDEHGALFARSGIPFYVCPGTSSWNSIAGRTDNCLNNLRNAAVNGLKHGAIGFLNTDWGDNGHWQYLPVSFLGFAAGAALSWCYEANHAEDFIAALDAHVFRDSSSVMGRLACDLGNAHLKTDCLMSNGTILFQRLFSSTPHEVSPRKLQETAEVIRSVIEPFGRAQMQRPDAALIKSEFANAARLLLAACEPERIDSKAIVDEHRRLWLARNRPGGLDDSLDKIRLKVV